MGPKTIPKSEMGATGGTNMTFPGLGNGRGRAGLRVENEFHFWGGLSWVSSGMPRKR